MKKDSSPTFTVVISNDTIFHLRFNTLLMNKGFDVIHIRNIHQASRVSLDNNILIIFVDSGILDHEKINDCVYLRKIFSKHIAVVSGENFDFFDEAELLNYGADAYLDGSRSDNVLLANIQALIRRKTNTFNQTNENIIVQDLELNLRSFQLFQRKKIIKLTHGEFFLLSILATQAGEIAKRNDLLIALFGTKNTGHSRSLDLRISLLRKKLGDSQKPYRYIKTIRGAGYLFLIA